MRRGGCGLSKGGTLTVFRGHFQKKKNSWFSRPKKLASANPAFGPTVASFCWKVRMEEEDRFFSTKAPFPTDSTIFFSRKCIWFMFSFYAAVDMMQKATTSFSWHQKLSTVTLNPIGFFPARKDTFDFVFLRFFSLYFVCDAKTDSVQKPTSARPLLEATVCACVRVYVSNSLWWICAHCVSLSNQKNQKSCFKISLFFQLLKGLTLVLKSTVAIKADTNRVEFATFI